MTAIGETSAGGKSLASLSNAAGAPGHAVIAPLFQAFCHIFVRRLGSLTTTFEQPLPDGPFMVCANHRSHIDSIVLMAATGLPFANCGLLAAEDYYFRKPARLRIVSSVLRIIPVERRPTLQGFEATLGACRRFLDTAGRMIVAYPEGTRGTGAVMARFKRGPAILALRYGLPVVPAFVSGTERVLPKGRSLPVPAAVSVRFGAPLLVSALTGAALRDGSKQLTDKLEAQLRHIAAGLPA